MGSLYLYSHNDDSSFLFDSGVAGQVGEGVNSHAQACDGRQIQPIRITNSTHAVFGHWVNGAVSIPQDDGTLLWMQREEKLRN